jgi:hypothetical protein
MIWRSQPEQGGRRYVENDTQQRHGGRIKRKGGIAKKAHSQHENRGWRDGHSLTSRTRKQQARSSGDALQLFILIFPRVFDKVFTIIAPVTQRLEYHPYKVGVDGSNPSRRTKTSAQGGCF